MHAPSDEILPKYFSGTNCRLRCSALAPTGQPRIIKANLWLGGTLVAKYDPPPPGENELQQSLASWNPEVTFSSLVFANGSYPVVSIEAKDATGSWYSASYSARVHNMGMVYGRSEFEMSGYADWHGCANSISGLSDLGHAVPGGMIAYDQPWAPQDFFNSLALASAVYVHSHGSDWPTCFKCNDDSLPDSANWIFPSTAALTSFYPSLPSPPAMVLEERAAVTGIDDLLPPFNVSEGVPVSFAFLDFCSSSASSEWSAFVMHGAATAPSGELVPREAENTAVLGWVSQAKIRWARQATSTLWCDLAIGLTVTEARHDIIAQLPIAEVEECLNMEGPFADIYVMGISPSGTMPQHMYTRLGEYVYTGDLFVAPYLWYR